MKEISIDELNNILRKHVQWLDGFGGERADLHGVNLANVDLHGRNLQYANLRMACLSNTNLSDADLRSADLSYANLDCADLHNTKLCGADLKYINRPWLIYTGLIGSRCAETVYLADYDKVLCGCWKHYLGGTLSEFKTRVDSIYPEKCALEIFQKYRTEYLSAIATFEFMRKEYLISKKVVDKC